MAYRVPACASQAKSGLELDDNLKAAMYEKNMERRVHFSSRWICRQGQSFRFAIHSTIFIVFEAY